MPLIEFTPIYPQRLGIFTGLPGNFLKALRYVFDARVGDTITIKNTPETIAMLKGANAVWMMSVSNDSHSPFMQLISALETYGSIMIDTNTDKVSYSEQ